MKTLSFSFDADKLVPSLVFFAKSGVPDLTKGKAAKLLYFVDKYHLLKYGRPVLGDRYFCMDHGPVPSFSLNLMDEADDTESSGRDDFFQRHLNIEHRDGLSVFVARAEATVDLEVFSKSDVEALEFVAQRYGSLTFQQLVDLAHKETTWQAPNLARKPGGRKEIPYQLFFEGASGDMRELAEAEQDDRDLGDYLNGNARFA